MNHFYAGGFLHADDVRTLAFNSDTLNSQMDLVKEFADKNYLKLNTQKCEIVTFDRGRKESIVAPNCGVDGVAVPSGSAGKCLGFWWSGDLGAIRTVQENIGKARRAFFYLGSLGVFKGDLMYGCENWILTEVLYSN